MNTIKGIIAAAVACLTALLAHAGEPSDPVITVGQVVQKAVTNQPLIKKAEAALETARARVGQAQSGYYPTISASASYTRMNPIQTVEFGGASFSLTELDNWNFDISLNQALFQSGRTKLAVELTRTGASIAETSLQKATSDVAFQAVRIFYTVLFLQEKIKVIEDKLQNLEEHEKIVKEKERTGTATNYDVLATQVRVAAAEGELNDSQNELERQKIALEKLTRMDMSHAIVSGSFSPDGEVETVRSLLDRALEKRPALRIAREEESAARIQSRIARSGALPGLYARVAYGYRNGLLPDMSALTANWNAGIQLAVPIFSGKLNKYKIKEAESELENASETRATVTDSVSTQVEQAAADIAWELKQLKITQVHLNQAEELLAAAEVQYGIGAIANLEYLDSQTSLAQAKLDYQYALYRVVMSEYELRECIGEKIW